MLEKMSGFSVVMYVCMETLMVCLTNVRLHLDTLMVFLSV